MKFIPLRDGEPSSKVFFRFALESAAASERGMSIADMEKRLRVLKALREEDTCLVLEDADWQTLKTVVAQVTWARASEAVMDQLIAIKTDLETATSGAKEKHNGSAAVEAEPLA